MERFKKFISKDKKANDGVIPNYVHGKHSEEVKNSKNDGIMPNYVHGKHSSTKKDIKESEDQKEHSSIKDYEEHHKEFETREHMDKDLGSHYDEHIALHPDVEHVKRYTSSSAGLNRSLLDQHNANTPLSDNYKKRSEGLSNAITSIPSHKEFHTYSGLGFDPRRHVDEHGHLHSPAFLSSSPDIHTASGFAYPISDVHGTKTFSDREDAVHHILKIKVPKGSTHGAYVNGSSNLGRHSVGEHGTGELEYIANKGTTYKVNPKPTIIKNEDGKVTHMIHHADIIDGGK